MHFHAYELWLILTLCLKPQCLVQIHFLGLRVITTIPSEVLPNCQIKSDQYYRAWKPALSAALAMENQKQLNAKGT